MARIYISSTREDLQNEREAAAKAVRRLGHEAIYMEEYVASNLSPLEQCLQDVESCDVYVGLFAFRYGFIPAGQKKSITHLEYEATVKAGIPCLIFLLDPDAPHRVKFVATGDERQKIDHLRQELKDKYVVSFFQNAEELGGLVSSAVSNPKLYQPKKVIPPSNSTPPQTSILAAYGVPYDFVEIPGGEFKMGSENGYDDERPVHTVRVSGFRMGKTEVTQGLWKAEMGDNPSRFKKGDDYPVEQVSWNDCQEFLKRLNKKTGGNYRLPYEAEWEYACRAGTTGDYYGNLNYIAWYDKNSNNSTHPVGQKKENAFGLYDMSGNVYEWCIDWFRLYDGSNQIDPTGPNSGGYRVCRGGSWFSSGRNVRSAIRDRNHPDDRSRNLGLRLAQVISSPASKK